MSTSSTGAAVTVMSRVGSESAVLDAILVSTTNFVFGITSLNGAVVGRFGSETTVSDAGEIVSDFGWYISGKGLAEPVAVGGLDGFRSAVAIVELEDDEALGVTLLV